jgi:hypothetical protein
MEFPLAYNRQPDGTPWAADGVAVSCAAWVATGVGREAAVAGAAVVGAVVELGARVGAANVGFEASCVAVGAALLLQAASKSEIATKKSRARTGARREADGRG